MVSVDALYCIIVSWTDGLLAGTLPSLSLISPPLLPPSSHVFFPCLSLISSFLVCCPLVTQHGSCKACREYSCTSKNTRAPDLTLQALWTTQEKQPFMPIKSTLERDNVQLQKKIDFNYISYLQWWQEQRCADTDSLHWQTVMGPLHLLAANMLP